MNEAQARSRLESMVASAEEPILSDGELADLLDLAKRTDYFGNLPRFSRRSSTAYGVGDVVVLSPRDGHWYTCTTAGTTAATAPSFDTASGHATTDGSVTWTEGGLDSWTPTFELSAAAAEGWRWKAGKVAPKFDAALGDGVVFSRSQMYQNCMAQAERYSRSLTRSVSAAPDPYAPTAPNPLTGGY